jgi:HEAT repeat protein/beta-lactamase regulating signal transducer with metallopeptidase domain
MTVALMNSALAWLLTYAMHSTLLLGVTWMVTRRATMTPHAKDILWKVALIGGLLTAAAQQQWGVRAYGAVALNDVASAPADRLDPALTTNTGDDAKRAKSDALRDPKVGSGSLNVPAAATPAPAIAIPSTWQSRVVVGWLALAALFAVVYVSRRLILVGRLANRRAIVDGPLPAMLDALCRVVGHRARVRLTSVNSISSPVALGLNEICVPEAALTDLEPEQQRSLLAHELAHLARRDPLWLIGAALMERVFFFQPLNRVARKALQQNAEFLCDDWAATQAGSGLPLAHCLARVAEWIEVSPLGVPVAGMAEQRSLLVTRIARLIEGRRVTTATSRLAVAMGAVALLAVTTAAAPGVQRARLDDVTTPKSLLGIPMPDPEPARDPQASVTSESAQEDPAVVTALIDRLKDSDAGVRRAAASSLGRLKSRRAVSALTALLSDRNREVRSAAVEALANIDDASAVPALLRSLSDEWADVRMHALEGLGKFRDDLRANQVTALLKDANPNVRLKAAELLGEIGDSSAADDLLPLLRDANANVRHESVHALTHLKARSAGPAILPLLRDPDSNVRGAALEALGELKVTVSERELTPLLEDVDPNVRSRAVEYIKDSPAPSYIPVLRKMLEDANGGVREQAVDALAEMRDPAARVALRAALASDDPKVRRRAAEALGDRP